MAVDLYLDAQAVERRLKEARGKAQGSPGETLGIADAVIAELGVAAPATLLGFAFQVRGMALAYLGRYEASVQALHSALERVGPNPTVQRVAVLRAMCGTHEQMSALEEALDWANQAVEVARILGDAEGLAENLLSVGVVLSRSGNIESGLSHFREARTQFEASGNLRSCMNVVANIGISLGILGRNEEAVEHVMQAMQMARDLGDDATYAMAASNLGEPLWKLGRLSEARAAMAEAVLGLRAGGNIQAEIYARIQLGQILQDAGVPEGALAEFERARALSDTHGIVAHAALLHLALSQTHKAAGHFEAALENYEAYHAAERIQFNDQSARKLRALQVRMELASARHEAETERLRSAELLALSRTDALTGLDNRRQLDARLAQEFAQAQRHDRPLALAMCDIDNFKLINDKLGHPVGDAVLRAVALLLRNQCRDTDMVARFGGEEFCWVFHGIDAAQAERACESARTAIEGHDWTPWHPDLRVTASFGLAGRQSLDSPSALIEEADKQLYVAKRSGKNRVAHGG